MSADRRNGGKKHCDGQRDGLGKFESMWHVLGDLIEAH